MSKEATAKKAPAKGQIVNPLAVSKDLIRQTVQAIHKATNQKPLGAMDGPHPHLPSGSTVIDTLIGGTPLPNNAGFKCPGLPCGRIVEVYGAESSGKTTAMLKAISAVQAAGGAAMFLDYENALDHGYAKSIGVSFDEDKLLYYTPNTLEEGFKMLYIAIRTGIPLVVVDSVAAMVPKDELEKNLDDPARIGALARAMSSILPKMVQWLKSSRTCVAFINQTRSLISKSSHGGEDDNTSGGKALKFYCSLRMKLTRIRSDFVEIKDPITMKKKRQPYGNLVQVKIVKDKMDARQGATGEVFIRYGYGIDEYMTLIEAGVARKAIKKEGAYYAFGGERHQGKERFRKYLMTNPKAFEGIREKVMAAILASAPEPLTGEDEIEDSDIVSDANSAIGSDDDVFDAEGEEAIEESIVDDAEAAVGGAE